MRNVTKRDEEFLARIEIGLEWYPILQHLGNLHPRVHGIAALRVLQTKSKRGRQIRQERERMFGVQIGPFEQGRAVVEGLGENALIEVQPTQIAVDPDADWTYPQK